MYSDDFHNKIANLACKHFKSLAKTGKPTQNEWTVMSSIIQQNKDKFDVISLATGTKCIGKSQMSSNGDILNDSHAEILCRRAFLRYIYHQMNEKNNIFTLVNKKFLLNKDVTFHFFSTQTPCGDAAIFPTNNDDNFGQILPKNELENHKHKKIKLDFDNHITGAKCLQNDPNLTKNCFNFTTAAVRTKPGRGDPTLSVSCSDKIAKWLKIGIQGALMTFLVEKPIFLSTFTIAGEAPFNREALERALYDRFPKTTQTKMKIGQSKLTFDFQKNDDKQACPSSVIYCKLPKNALEVGVGGKKQGITKAKRNSKAARLKITKIELFQQFLKTLEIINKQLHEDVKLLTYNNVKMRALAYQESWQKMKTEDFQIWTTKPLTDFVIE